MNVTVYSFPAGVHLSVLERWLMLPRSKNVLLVRNYWVDTEDALSGGLGFKLIITKIPFRWVQFDSEAYLFRKMDSCRPYFLFVQKMLVNGVNEIKVKTVLLSEKHWLELD